MKVSKNVLFYLFFITLIISCGKNKSNHNANKPQIISKNAVFINLDLTIDEMKEYIPQDISPFIITSKDNTKKVISFLEKRYGTTITEDSPYFCQTTDDFDSQEIEEEYTDLFKKQVSQCTEKFKKFLASKNKKIDFFIGDLNEKGILLSGELRSKYKLPKENGMDFETSLQFADKGTMVSKLINTNHNNIHVPKTILITKNNFNEKSFEDDFIKQCSNNLTFEDKTIIIKPTLSSGSIGIKVLENINDCKELYNKFSEYYKTNKNIEFIIQDFISGEMYRLDGYVKNGKIAYNYTSKYGIPPINFWQNAVPNRYSMIDDHKEQEIFNDIVQTIMIDTYNVTTAITHIELIQKKSGINAGKFYFVEAAVRPGAGLASAFDKMGYDTEKAYYYQQMGKTIDTPPTDNSFEVINIKCPYFKKGDEKALIIKTETDNKENYPSLIKSYLRGKQTIKTPGCRCGFFTFVGDQIKVHEEASEFFKSINIHIEILNNTDDTYDKEMILKYDDNNDYLLWFEL